MKGVLIFLFAYFTILFNLYALIRCYGKISNVKVKFNVFNIVVMLILSIISYVSNYYLGSITRVVISFISLLIVFKFIFKENFILSLFKLFIIYCVLCLCDFFLSTVFLFVNINSSGDLGNVTIIRILCTILVSLLVMLSFIPSKFINFINKMINFMISKWSKLLLILACSLCLVFAMLLLYTAYNFNLTVFLISLVLMFIFLFFSLVLIFQYFKNKRSEEEQKTLLNLMNEYEKILEKDRINRHEMLNNLIVLKSKKNKNSKEYEELLDSIIEDYQMKKSNFYSKLSHLPSGIKGIIYYKLANIDVNNINFNLIISNEVKELFETFDSKLYYKICKILGILIDNALEATSISEIKILVIDMYFENDTIVVHIENSFSETIEISEMNKKGVSSKGEGRGYGLYIVNKLVKESKNIEFKQFINENNNFVSLLKIKNPSIN